MLLEIGMRRRELQLTGAAGATLGPIVPMPRMATAAAIHRKGDCHVAGSTVQAIQIFFLVKGHGTHVLDFKNTRVAVRTVKPGNVGLVGKNDKDTGLIGIPA